MGKLTKKDKLYFMKESIKSRLLDDDKREDMENDFKYYFDIKLSNWSRLYLDNFKRAYENLWYIKKNYWYAFELAQRKINTVIRNILKYNDFKKPTTRADF